MGRLLFWYTFHVGCQGALAKRRLDGFCVGPLIVLFACAELPAAGGVETNSTGSSESSDEDETDSEVSELAVSTDETQGGDESETCDAELGDLPLAPEGEFVVQGTGVAAQRQRR